MTRSIRLDEKLRAEVERQLTRSGKSFSEFAREALAEKIARDAEKKTPFEAGKHLFGKHGSGRGDLSERSDEIYREKMRAKHAKRSR